MCSEPYSRAEVPLWTLGTGLCKRCLRKRELMRNPPARAQLYLFREGEQEGPYPPNQIRGMWKTGQIEADALCCFAKADEWFPVRTFCQPSRRGDLSIGGWLGVFLVVVGLAVASIFLWGYDTSRYVSGVGRVHNQGLLQNRLLGSIVGLVLFVVGIVLAAVGARQQKE